MLRKNSLLKPKFLVAIAIAVVAASATGTAILYSFSRFQRSQNPSPIPSVSTPAVRAVTALGRLEPKGEVIQLSAPTSTDARSPRIDQLLVKERDRVRSGQVIAILDNHERFQAAVNQSQAQVMVAQTHLAQVKAGAKAGDITAQEATVARVEAQLTIDQKEFRRYQYLYQTGAIAGEMLDNKRLAVETAQKQLSQAKSTLRSIAEVRPTDVQAAQAEVDSSIAAVKQAQANLNLAYVRAPMDGQILKIHTWPGEEVGDKGIADMGRTDQMYAVAEIYETDVGKVYLGQHATITSEAFVGKLQGTIDQIGMEIGKKDILNTDPAADVDARVVEVKIRLKPEDSRRVIGLTRLKVKVAINI